MQDRLVTLKRISGLEVTHRLAYTLKGEKAYGSNIFEFFCNGKLVKTCYTYDKAKLFAEGVAFGKSQRE